MRKGRWLLWLVLSAWLLSAAAESARAGPLCRLAKRVAGRIVRGCGH